MTEELNASIEAVEGHLLNLGLSVSAEVSLYPGDGGVILGFGKISNCWQLYARTNDDRRPLTSCSRAFRVQAMSRLDDLLDRMEENGTTSIRDVERAVERAGIFLERPESKLPPTGGTK